MFFTKTIILAASLLNGIASADPLLEERAACAADNCARGVVPLIKQLIPTRKADCSAFLKATFTPAGIFTSTTITLITSGNPTPTPPILPTAKLVIPTAVASYAAHACGTGATLLARYTSVCVNCLSITKTTMTVATPSLLATAIKLLPVCSAGKTGMASSGAFSFKACDTYPSDSSPLGAGENLDLPGCVNWCRGYAANAGCYYNARDRYCVSYNGGSNLVTDKGVYILNI